VTETSQRDCTYLCTHFPISPSTHKVPHDTAAASITNISANYWQSSSSSCSISAQSPIGAGPCRSKDAPLRLEKMTASQYVFPRAILFIFHTIRRELYPVGLFCLDALKCMHLSSRNSISLFLFSFNVTAADRKSQRCGSVTGPGFGFNSISIPGGPLTITLTWQKGVVEEQFMDRFATYLSRRLMLDFKNCVM
jgi:hypothetical protein